MIKEKRKNKVEPYGKKEKFKIRIKLPKFWWLVAGWILFALFSGIFRGIDDMPDYMTTIDDKRDNVQDPSLYQDPDEGDDFEIYNNTFVGGEYKYPEQQTNDSLEALIKIIGTFPSIIILIGLTVPIAMIFLRSFRRW